MRTRIVGYFIQACAVFYAFTNTARCGNHWLPGSNAEAVLDGLALIILALGVLIVAITERTR